MPFYFILYILFWLKNIPDSNLHMHKCIYYTRTQYSRHTHNLTSTTFSSIALLTLSLTAAENKLCQMVYYMLPVSVCVCVCVCVCVWEWVSAKWFIRHCCLLQWATILMASVLLGTLNTASTHLRRSHAYTHAYTHKHTHSYIYRLLLICKWDNSKYQQKCTHTHMNTHHTHVFTLKEWVYHSLQVMDRK